MESVLVTEKNIANIYGKVLRFFEEKHGNTTIIRSYHTYGSGFRRNIPPYYKDFKTGNVVPTARFYYDSEIWVKFNPGNDIFWPSVTIHLDLTHSCIITVGERIYCDSNRIVIQRTNEDPCMNYMHHLYAVFMREETKKIAGLSSPAIHFLENLK